MSSSELQINLLELEKLFKCIASWKRLKILSELTKHEEGLSYTDLTNAIEDQEVKKTKSSRIDFHLEELRKSNLVHKDVSLDLYNNQNREIYRISHAGRNIQSLIISIGDQNTIFSPPKDGFIFQDYIELPNSLDLESLTFLMNFVHDFRKIPSLENNLMYTVVSDQLHKYPHVGNLSITFEFILSKRTKNSFKSHELRITAYWNIKTSQKSETVEKNFDSIKDLNIKIENSLIFIIQELLSRIHDVIYDMDVPSAKAISNKIVDYIEMTGNQISEMIVING